ncbi:MAG: hypothetical protein PVJ98_04650 [Akkermansiaceae bacterium]|jgi:L-lactate dehydrogenase
MKVSIVGLGRVGAAVGFVLTLYEQCDELVIINRSRDKADAEAIDLSHCAAFGGTMMTIRSGTYEDAAGSDIVILCASCSLKPGSSGDRMELAQSNWDLYGELMPQLLEHAPDSIYLVVANPIDVLTYRVQKLSNLDPSKVMGTGTINDTARYRNVIARRKGIHPVDIRGYVLGEHGESQFPTISITNAGGEPADDEDEHWEAFEEAKHSAYTIYKARGYTNYAIAKTVSMIVHSIRHDARHTMPVSHLIQGSFGVSDVCLSLPCVIGRNGIERELKPSLSDQEIKMFQDSASSVRNAITLCEGSE